MSTVESTVSLDADQVAAFHRDGFLSLPALTTPDEVALLREVYDRLFSSTGGTLRDGDHLGLAKPDEEGRETLPQILNPETYAPELLETQARVNAFAVAGQLLGPDVARGGDHAIMKPAGHGAPTPWHQDEAYWHPGYDHQALSFWMPLQDTTVEMGCMQFVPGSHALDVRPHRLANPEAHALELDPAEAAAAGERAVACPLPAGGVTVHHCRTVHYAGPNRSGFPRRAYIMGFQVAPTPIEPPHNYYWQRPEWYASEQP